MKQVTGIFLFFFLCFMASPSFSQENDDKQLLKVSGNSKTSVAPDLGVLHVNVNHINMSASQAIVGLNNKTKEVYNKLASLGIKENDIKTINFSIAENRVYRRDEYRDSGYVASQTVQVEFSSKKERISEILTAFSDTKTNFQLGFSFKLSDELKKKVKNDLIKEAINDAKDKANLIASSAGVKLLKIAEINYGVFSDNVYQPVYEMAAMAKSGNDIMGFTPQDIELNDKVIVMWEFE